VVDERKRPKRWRRLLWIGAALLVAWLALSHFVVRRGIRGWLGRHFNGEPGVTVAIVWPHLDVTAFGLEVEAEHHRLSASRVGLDVNPLGLFGGRLINAAHVSGFECRVDEGAPLRILKMGSGAKAGESSSGADLDPYRLCPLTFSDTAVDLRGEEGGVTRVFVTESLSVAQEGDKIYDMVAGHGGLVGVPFERLTARLVTRADHLVLAGMKMRAFNGMVAGFMDVDMQRAGAVNGEVEWRYVEASRIWKTYGLPYAEKRRGDLQGRLVFSASRPALDALKGKGSLRLTKADFFSPLSFKVFLVLKIPVASEAPINRADMVYSFEKSLAYVEQAKAYAREFELEGKGIVSFSGEVDLEVDHAGTTVAVGGSVTDPDVTVLPFDHVTLPFDRMFRDRIGER
jgi:hypothetical protein